MVNKEPLIEPPNGYSYRSITMAFRSDKKYLVPLIYTSSKQEYYQCVLTNNMCYNGDCSNCKVPFWSNDIRIIAMDRVLMKKMAKEV